MTRSIVLESDQRSALLDTYRKHPDPEVRFRAHILLLLAGLPPDETVVWQDEADINTNPEIGRMWMKRGQQATIPTPGTNQKRYVAGSIHWRTGQVFATQGPRRNEELFLAHLEDLRRR